MTKFKFSLLFLYVSYRDSNSHVSTKSILCNHVPITFPRGILLGILGGGVPPGSPNPDPTSDQKISFSIPFSDPEVVTKRNITCLHKTEIMSSLVRLKLQQKKSHFEFMLHFLSYSFGIETTNTLIHNRSSFVNHTRFQTKTAQKPYHLGVADTYMACIRESPPVMFQTCFLAYLFH